MLLHKDGHFYCRKCLNLCYDKQLESKQGRLWSIVYPSRDEEDEAEKLYTEIKYPIRNGKPTRKQRRYLKLTRQDIPYEERHRISEEFLNSIRSKLN